MKMKMMIMMRRRRRKRRKRKKKKKKKKQHMSVWSLKSVFNHTEVVSHTNAVHVCMLFIIFNHTPVYTISCMLIVILLPFHQVVVFFS